jgi:hypothetical protein
MTELAPQTSPYPDLPPPAETLDGTGSRPNDLWPDLARGLWPIGAKTDQLALAAAADVPAVNPIFDSPSVSDSELTFMQSQGGLHSAKEIAAIKDQIAKGAKDPEQALLNAVQNNRVVGFADVHGPLGPHMTLLADEMPKLKQNGITDLAMEIPQVFQAHVDSWTDADQAFIRDRMKDRGSIVQVIDAAKKAGIKVACVDEFYTADGEKLASRDRTMAKNINGILADPAAKVAYFAGAEHLQNGSRLDSFGPSTVELLRQKQVSVATFLQQTSSTQDVLMPIARDLKTAVSINKADVSTIGSLKNSGGTTYDKWDNVIFYPPHYKMESVEAELKQFGHDPKADLTEALKHNQVVLLGEMSQGAPEQETSAHRNFMASAVPDLRKAGLTDLAIDLPSAYQQTLDDFSKSGTFSGPLPDTYDQQDFKAVLTAAQKAGIKFHAVGLKNESISSPQQIVEGLATAAADIARANPHTSKTLVWCHEEKVANFKDDQGQSVSVASLLAAKGVSARAFASFTQDFTDWSLGFVTEITPTPLSFAPGQTKLLKDVSNTHGFLMDSFDNVIVYPSPGAMP